MRRALVLSIVILVTVWLGTKTTEVSFGHEASVVGGVFGARCLSDREISNALRKLASGKLSEVDLARAVLVDNSKRSPQCRSEVIAALMKAMDRPNLDFNRDAGSFHLWRHGGALLGDLKASDALDLLILHLNQSGPFFSSSMNHMPALQSVIRMGSIAIPKLDEVLRHNPDLKMRYSAVYCIATIGGDSAARSLREALASESDDCAKRLIRVSLDSFDNEGQIKNRLEWYAAFTCK